MNLNNCTTIYQATVDLNWIFGCLAMLVVSLMWALVANSNIARLQRETELRYQDDAENTETVEHP